MKRMFSIIMPVYNSEKYLASAIESVLAQTYRNFELFLIDDGSKDSSPEICDEYAKKDERIHVIHKENEGICRTRNLGLKLAKGDYIGFMDNDDILELDMLSECFELIKKHGADWIKFGKREILLYGERELSVNSTNFEYKVYSGDEIRKNLLFLREKGVMTFVWDSFIKKECLQESGITFDESFPLGNEDIDFCERYAFYSEKLVVSDQIYYNHFTRMGVSASTRYSEEKINSYIYLLSKCNERYISNNILNMDNKNQYVNIVTRQIVVNLCQKLNDVGDSISKKEKKQILDKCRNSKEFDLYENFKDIENESLKFKLYRTLFLNKKFGLLLILDKYSRKLVYAYRKLRAGRE